MRVNHLPRFLIWDRWGRKFSCRGPVSNLSTCSSTFETCKPRLTSCKSCQNKVHFKMVGHSQFSTKFCNFWSHATQRCRRRFSKICWKLYGKWRVIGRWGRMRKNWSTEWSTWKDRGVLKGQINRRNNNLVTNLKLKRVIKFQKLAKMILVKKFQQILLTLSKQQSLCKSNRFPKLRTSEKFSLNSESLRLVYSRQMSIWVREPRNRGLKLNKFRGLNRQKKGQNSKLLVANAPNFSDLVPILRWTTKRQAPREMKKKRKRNQMLWGRCSSHHERKIWHP